MSKTTDSFNHAIDGIVIALKSERNMRFHFALALGVLVAALFFNVSKIELLILIISMTLVIFAEMINTAIEYTLNKKNMYHPMVKGAKDIAAGAVLITALNAIVVGYIIFWNKLANISLQTIRVVKNSNTYVLFITIIIISMLVIIIKALTTNGASVNLQENGKHGTYLKGGMPSGHATLAFALATIVAFVTNEQIVILIVYILAVIVAQSRVDSQVHKISEVIVGAVLGVSSAVIILKLFYSYSMLNIHFK